MKLYKYFLFFCFLFIACDDNDDDKDIVPPVIPGGTLIEAEKIDDIDIGTLQESLGHVFAGVSSDIVNDDVLIPISAYRISYQTNHPNNTEKIIASGLLLIPESEEAPPIISYQHGTITEDESAPSYFEIH
ncbi:MAG: hypothetical protein ISP68_04445 [Flavobacteriaceae bacterium]|nr:hypothetical protein [Flavobacteriaceae bacterium]